MFCTRCGRCDGALRVALLGVFLFTAVFGQEPTTPAQGDAKPDYKLSPRFRESAVRFRGAMFSYAVKLYRSRLDEKDKDREEREMDATKESEGDKLLSLLASEWQLVDTTSNDRRLDGFLKKRKLSRVDVLMTCNKEFSAFLEKREITPEDHAKSQCHLWAPEFQDEWFRQFKKRLGR